MFFKTLASLVFLVFYAHGDPAVIPETQHLQSPVSGVVKCEFSTPLTGCVVRVSEHYKHFFDSLVNFTSGVRSPRVEMHEHYTSNYAGQGLDPERECGVKVDITHWGVLLVECFGQTLDGQWDRGLATMPTDANKVMPVTYTTPGLLIAAPGDNLSVLLKVNMDLAYCFIETPSAGMIAMASGTNPPTSGRYLQYGAGASNRECGATLQNVQESDAGVWFIRVYGNSSPWHSVWQATVVLVQTVPVGYPVLEIQDKNNLFAGKILEAKCMAPSAVPHGNLTWLLGGHVVRQDNLNDTLPEDVGKSRPWHRQPMHQTFRRVITAGDMGKILECRMDHIALAGPKTVGHELQATATTPTATTPTETTPEQPDNSQNCGEVFYAIDPRIAGGEDAGYWNFHWHVGIYRAADNKQICGGTLVSRAFVISAAHCFWDENLGKLKSPSLYQVAAGNYLRAWSPQNSQVSNVTAINIPERYRGRIFYHQHDIAVLQLSSPVNWDQNVQPICIDWNERRDVAIEITPITNGSVAGWGLTAAGTEPSEVLQTTDLPVVDFNTCFNSLTNVEQKKLLTGDKFCAGFANQNRSVCPGDSGGGLVFPTENRLFLRGIVSVNFKPFANKDDCYSQHYTAFTDVTQFVSWIKNIVNSLQPAQL